MFKVLGEALDRYPLNRVFSNIIGYRNSDYSGNYQGLCQCGNCKWKDNGIQDNVSQMNLSALSIGLSMLVMLSGFHHSQKGAVCHYPKTTGAYTESISIGPELVQHLMSFPRK